VRPRVLEWLVCPLCEQDLELRGDDGGDAAHVDEGTLVCRGNHAFPVEGGVPRLLPGSRLESDDARSLRKSYSRQWQHFDHTADDRTWGQTLAERRADFLRLVDRSPEELRGKLVLDAGCGNGALSSAISDFGCEVLAADISDAVEAAHAHLATERTHFVQADLMTTPFRRDTFDIVFCAGVIIVTPDSRRTLEQVARAVAPGGTIFVWVYWREPGRKYRFKTFLRKLMRPLPIPARHAVAFAFVSQAMLRQVVRRLARRGDDGGGLKWREHLTVQLDFFLPRYRWEHTPDEVRGWYRDLGFVDAKVTKEEAAGFGMIARRPGAPVSQSAIASAAAPTD
jgi:2-polyprenyl-3-methyl-5-hydroxy-6-metoxy-1,4-benzoquinol methylase